MKVKFVPIDKEIDIEPNETLLQAAKRNGVFIKSLCGGMPSCAECRVKVLDGEHNVIKPTKKELNLIGTSYFIDNRRLACQLRCFGDITIDITEQIEKLQVATKRPQGTKTIVDDSRAVRGTLILEDQDIKVSTQNFVDVEEKKAAELEEKRIRNQLLKELKTKKLK